MMKTKNLFLFFLVLMVFLVFSGCIHNSTNEQNTESTPVPPIATTPLRVDDPVSPQMSAVAPGMVNAGTGTIGSTTNATLSVTTSVPIRIVNYSEIQFIGKADPSDPVDESRKNTIAKAALADERVQALILEGGTIEGVLFQCHPTPKDFSGSACAPALRIFHNGINWDFLVDEKSQEVIFIQRETPPREQT